MYDSAAGKTLALSLLPLSLSVGKPKKHRCWCIVRARQCVKILTRRISFPGLSTYRPLVRYHHRMAFAATSTNTPRQPASYATRQVVRSTVPEKEKLLSNINITTHNFVAHCTARTHNQLVCSCVCSYPPGKRHRESESA